MLKWARKHREYWRMICTADDDRMTRDTMKKIIETLCKASTYELIFVMLTVHRSRPFVSDLLSDMTNYLVATRWKNESEGLIDRIINYL